MCIRLVVGEKPFNPASSFGGPTKMKDYPFKVAAFVPSPLKFTNKSFVRVLGLVYGKTMAKKLIKEFDMEYTPKSVVEKFEKDRVWLGNANEKEQLRGFLDSHKFERIKILALGDVAINTMEQMIEDYDNQNVELFKFSHPSKAGNNAQLFEKFDPQYNKKYDNPQKIIDDFTI